MVERENLLVMEHSFQRRYEKWKLSNGISVRRNSPIEESNAASEFIFSSTEENAMCITVLWSLHCKMVGNQSLTMLYFSLLYCTLQSGISCFISKVKQGKCRWSLLWMMTDFNGIIYINCLVKACYTVGAQQIIASISKPDRNTSSAICLHGYLFLFLVQTRTLAANKVKRTLQSGRKYLQSIHLTWD